VEGLIAHRRELDVVQKPFHAKMSRLHKYNSGSRNAIVDIETEMISLQAADLRRQNDRWRKQGAVIAADV